MKEFSFKLFITKILNNLRWKNRIKPFLFCLLRSHKTSNWIAVYMCEWLECAIKMVYEIALIIDFMGKLKKGIYLLSLSPSVVNTYVLIITFDLCMFVKITFSEQMALKMKINHGSIIYNIIDELSERKTIFEHGRLLLVGCALCLTQNMIKWSISIRNTWTAMTMTGKQCEKRQ